MTGKGVVFRTSLRRRGELTACSPVNALNRFFRNDLQVLIVEETLVMKK
ncbi:MAG: hypothetical protein V7756_06475 [Halopseudomonas sp.]